MEPSESLMEDERETTTVRKVAADNVLFKILVPSIAAGAIIGKGGEAIAQLQKEKGAKVKMSKATDFYPGTTERVCLIQGSQEAVAAVCEYVMEKVLEKPDPNPRLSGDGKLNVERHKQVKILVPNSTAGMIIGKKGAYVKEIMDNSGAYVQISQKPKEQTLSERCVTVAGDLDSNKEAIGMILAKIAEDPQSGSCSNISYADVNGPVASAFPTGSPYAAISQIGARSPVGQSGLGGGGGSGAFAQMSLDTLRSGVRHSGYSDTAADDIVGAMATLANYGFFNLQSLMSSNVPTTLLSSPVMSAFGLQAAAAHANEAAASGHSSNAAGTSSRAFDAFQSGYGDDDDKTPGGVCKRELEVPESLIGVVIGPGGKDIVELQAATQTSIQVSKRGEYQGQTRNRIVSITGAQMSVGKAERLIQQRVKSEEIRRQQQQQQSSLVDSARHA